MAVFHQALRALVGERELLPESLLDVFPELHAVRVRRGGLPPRVGGWCLGTSTVSGITVWRTVWLGNNVRATAELLLHELRHVHQFQSVRAFPLRYLWESLRRGYHHNRFEVDARQFALARTSGLPEVPLSEDA